MRAGDLWRNLTRRLGIETPPKPEGYEVFNGSLIFWFPDGEELRKVLRLMNESRFPYHIEWDKEEGLIGLVIKREYLKTQHQVP